MKVSKSGLFLFELIVVIFLFTVSAAVCISIFASSYNYSTQSENLTKCTLKAETAAEVFKDSGGDADAITEALGAENGTYDIIMTEAVSPDSEYSTKAYTLNIYFDRLWVNTDQYNSEYVFTVDVETSQQSSAGYMLTANINVTGNKDKENIFSMTAKKFIGSDSEEAAHE